MLSEFFWGTAEKCKQHFCEQLRKMKLSLQNIKLLMTSSINIFIFSMLVEPGKEKCPQQCPLHRVPNRAPFCHSPDANNYHQIDDYASLVASNLLLCNHSGSRNWPNCGCCCHVPQKWVCNPHGRFLRGSVVDQANIFDLGYTYCQHSHSNCVPHICVLADFKLRTFKNIQLIQIQWLGLRFGLHFQLNTLCTRLGPQVHWIYLLLPSVVFLQG